MWLINGSSGKPEWKLWSSTKPYSIGSYTVEEHMLATISEAYNIRKDNYEIYSILIADRKTSDYIGKYNGSGVCDRNGVVDSAIYVTKSLVNDPSKQFAETSSPTNLGQLFDDIKKNVTVTVSAWEVNDAMSQYVTFDGLVGSSSSVQVASDNKSFLWRVWKESGVK